MVGEIFINGYKTARNIKGVVNDVADVRSVSAA